MRCKGSTGSKEAARGDQLHRMLARIRSTCALEVRPERSVTRAVGTGGMEERGMTG